jgi:hypothetical protein
MTDVSDEFIINYPSLEDFWQSEYIRAFLWLHGGAPSSIRQPSTKQEREWCDWLKSFEDELRARNS